MIHLFIIFLGGCIQLLKYGSTFHELKKQGYKNIYLHESNKYDRNGHNSS